MDTAPSIKAYRDWCLKNRNSTFIGIDFIKETIDGDDHYSKYLVVQDLQGRVARAKFWEELFELFKSQPHIMFIFIDDIVRDIESATELLELLKGRSLDISTVRLIERLRNFRLFLKIENKDLGILPPNDLSKLERARDSEIKLRNIDKFQQNMTLDINDDLTRVCFFCSKKLKDDTFALKEQFLSNQEVYSNAITYEGMEAHIGRCRECARQQSRENTALNVFVFVSIVCVPTLIWYFFGEFAPWWWYLVSMVLVMVGGGVLIGMARSRSTLRDDGKEMYFERDDIPRFHPLGRALSLSAWSWDKEKSAKKIS